MNVVFKKSHFHVFTLLFYYVFELLILHSLSFVNFMSCFEWFMRISNVQ